MTNADTAVGFFTGYTDTAVIAGKTGNNNCMSYSPGALALADNTLWDADSQVGA